MVDAILSEIQPDVQSLNLIPSTGGRFEWTVNGDLVYSKKATGRYPELKDLTQAIHAKLT